MFTVSRVPAVLGIDTCFQHVHAVLNRVWSGTAIAYYYTEIECYLTTSIHQNAGLIQQKAWCLMDSKVLLATPLVGVTTSFVTSITGSFCKKDTPGAVEALDGKNQPIFRNGEKAYVEYAPIKVSVTIDWSKVTVGEVLDKFGNPRTAVLVANQTRPDGKAAVKALDGKTLDASELIAGRTPADPMAAAEKALGRMSPQQAEEFLLEYVAKIRAIQKRK